MTQAQKDEVDERIKNCAGFAAFDAARTDWEAEADPAAKHAKAITMNELVATCVKEAKIV